MLAPSHVRPCPTDGVIGRLSLWLSLFPRFLARRWRQGNPPRVEQLAKRLNDVGGLERAGHTDGQALTGGSTDRIQGSNRITSSAGHLPCSQIDH